MNERQAIARLKQGDIEGLETLVCIYQEKAVRAAYLITQDLPLAEDIVQAAFLRAYERIEQFDTGRRFEPWFLRSVINDAIKAARRRQRYIPLDGADTQTTLLDLLEDTAPGPLDQLVQTELKQAVREALRMLSPEQRAAVVMRYYLDMSEAEMVETANAPKGTIKWRLHAAREHLRRLLSRPMAGE
jgi:RNA polymerase sigma-70 factor (ECF subfamily)